MNGKDKFLLLLSLFAWLTLPGFAQEVETDEEADDGEEVVTDTSGIRLTAPMTWEEGLRVRLDSMLARQRTMTVYVSQRVRRHRYRKVRKTIVLHDRIGISVFDLTADSMLYRHNADELYIPASNQKLFVAITALDNLGEDYHFTTDASVSGELLRDSTDRPYLRGNIYLHDRFDPTLDKNSVAYLADKVDLLEADSIDGQVVCYEPLKRRITGEDWFWKKHPGTWMAATMADDMREDSVVFSTRHPTALLDVPCDSIGELYASISTPLPVVLKRMMKNSDNSYAESMLLNLCNPDSMGTWSYDACRQRVRDMVRRAGAQVDKYVIDDGSGLSHSNKTTPVIITDILRYAYGKSRIYKPLLNALPIAGVDGTLRKRMIGSPAYQKVFGKTGTVNGVSTLSGYLTARNGHQLAFSILMNSITSSSSAHALQDALCREMCR